MSEISLASTQYDALYEEVAELPQMTARTSPSLESIEVPRLETTTNSVILDYNIGYHPLEESKNSFYSPLSSDDSREGRTNRTTASYSNDDTCTALEIGASGVSIATTPKREVTHSGLANAGRGAAAARRGRGRFGGIPHSPHALFFPPPPAMFGLSSSFRNMSFGASSMRPYDPYAMPTPLGLPPFLHSHRLSSPRHFSSSSSPDSFRRSFRSPQSPHLPIHRPFPIDRSAVRDSRHPLSSPSTKPFRGLPDTATSKLPTQAGSTASSASSSPASSTASNGVPSPPRYSSTATVSSASNAELVPYPLVYVSPAGSISCLLNFDVVVEMAVDRSVRVVLHDGFAAMCNSRGTASAILHPNGRIMHVDEQVYTKFVANNEKMAVFGCQGVLFTMSHLSEAYLVNSSAYPGASAVALDQLCFPPMDDDFTLKLFYNEAQTGQQFMALCKDIVTEATYDRRPDGSLYLHINGMLIRQSPCGDVIVDARPRQISCSPKLKTVHVRSGCIDMAVEEDERGYVKKGSKRVHVSKSGMVISDGNCITSMDHFGRIVCCN